MEVELRGAPDSVTLERVCFLAGPVLYKPSATMSAVGGIEVLRIRQYVNALTLLQKKGEAYFIVCPLSRCKLLYRRVVLRWCSKHTVSRRT